MYANLHMQPSKNLRHFLFYKLKVIAPYAKKGTRNTLQHYVVFYSEYVDGRLNKHIAHYYLFR